MGKLAELAGTKRLKGAVQVTCMETGATRVCADEEEALSVVGSAHVEHRRGAFFYGKAAKAEEPVVVVLDEPKVTKKKTKKKSSRRSELSSPLDD